MAKTNVASCADVVSGRGPRPLTTSAQEAKTNVATIVINVKMLANLYKQCV